MVSFFPLKAIMLDGEEFQSLISRVEAAIEKADKEGTLTPLQRAVYPIQLEWCKTGMTPQVESFVFSRTLIPGPATHGKSGFVLMSGIQVGLNVTLEYNQHLNSRPAPL